MMSSPLPCLIIDAHAFPDPEQHGRFVGLEPCPLQVSHCSEETDRHRYYGHVVAIKETQNG